MSNAKFLIFLIGFVFLSCDTTEPIDNTGTNPTLACDPETKSSASIEMQHDAIKDFGFDLFKSTIPSLEGNVIQSPLSVYSALLLAYEGSACETKLQIRKTLALSDDDLIDLETGENYLSLMQSLNHSNDNNILTFANAIFYDDNRINISDSYVDKLKQNYVVSSEVLDFNSEAALNSINDWAAENTNDKIKKVLDEIASNEIAFLLNAIYFKGEWLNGFHKDSTSDQPFTLTDNSEISVPTMKHDSPRATYSDDRIKLVDLPLIDEKYAVSFFAPSANNETIDDLLLADDLEDIYTNALSQLNSERIILVLPKFEIKDKQKLRPILTELGIVDAFNGSRADFRKMGTANGNIFLTKVLHDTYVKVDENGFEGAAVTTIGVGVNSQPPSMVFDKPFAFVLRDVNSGVPIFIGKVENPLE